MTVITEGTTTGRIPSTTMATSNTPKRGSLLPLMYAIRKKDTDCFMPNITTQHGHSASKPEPQGGPLGPRLFMTKSGASKALASWLKGEWVRRPANFGTGELFEEQASYSGTGELFDIVHRPERVARDMAVVPVKLSIQLSDEDQTRLAGDIHRLFRDKP